MTDSRMKEYEAYKDSEIEWIGQIPKEWEVIKIKNLCNVTDGTHFSPRTESTGKPYVTVSNVNNDFVDVGNALLISEEDFDTLVRQGCQPKVGDVLLSKDGTVGRSAIVGNNNGFVCLSSLGILSPKAGLFSGYLKRSLDSIMLQYQMNRAMAGSALKRITISKINEFCMLLPPLSEQKAIAFYLDYKVGQIDASISAINTQIDDLKSYRQSIISEAVTKGLNPDVPMKDSGVEWIGEIPESWECLPMKRGLTINNGKDYKEIQSDEGYPVIGSGGQFAFATDYLYDGEAVLLGRKGTIDKPMYINGKFWTVDTMFYAVPSEDVCCKYMYYQAQTIPFGLYSTNTALPSMTQTDLANNPFCFPSLAEQQNIADYLDCKTAKIDSTISSLEAQRDDLNALKQSIISEAVTGKIDVRDWKANNV